MQEWLEGDGNYLAPELLTEQEPTFAADVYSAGATIFECCTGLHHPVNSSIFRDTPKADVACLCMSHAEAAALTYLI